ncbi:MAG: hypothetical protein QM750_19765 [Rubrivivax sp.]
MNAATKTTSFRRMPATGAAVLRWRAGMVAGAAAFLAYWARAALHGWTSDDVAVLILIGAILACGDGVVTFARWRCDDLRPDSPLGFLARYGRAHVATLAAAATGFLLVFDGLQRTFALSIVAIFLVWLVTMAFSGRP